jgi:mannose-6-phosphate isomerase
MWYIIDARPGSYLYSGFQKEISQEEYKKRIADGTITDVLARHEVKAGDVFYIPSGRVHAICSGILLAEVQQSSDVTYRIFDYNRPGMDGKPRELHTELAAQAINFKVAENYRTAYEYHKNCANTIIDSSYFNVRIVDTDKPYHNDLLQYDSFVIAMCIKGSCRIRIHKTGDEIRLQEGFSTLIPAVLADYDIIPDNEQGKSKVLDAFVANK